MPPARGRLDLLGCALLTPGGSDAASPLLGLPPDPPSGSAGGARRFAPWWPAPTAS
ncbi:hypothetical protein [Streptomyces sp. DSM 40907]|uniref:hypothetical protein n=1 Tax=Streptomyces kutzneri TaxID=3051179 RepID=UPI0028D01B81|nr:hypothetical protein [Streptomyces sp. DSM 40907]